LGKPAKEAPSDKKLEKLHRFAELRRRLCLAVQNVKNEILELSYHNRNVPVFSTIEMSPWLWFHAAPEKRARALAEKPFLQG
jgi:hypothetical protein